MPISLLRQIRDEGVSPWLDGVTRDELRSGTFRALVDDLGVSGVTTNPTLFAKSLAGAVAAYALADGVGQFQKSWQVVLAIVKERLAAAHTDRSPSGQ